MTSAPRTLVVMPAFNESDTIAEVIGEVRTALPAADIFVVDDGSSDGTTEVARAAGATVAQLAFNLGVGGAMRTGYRWAADNGYDSVVQIDSDGQHDPRDVPRLLAGLETADIVIGARFAGQGTYRARGPRRWAMILLARSLSLLARTRLTDVTSGFRATGPRATGLFARDYPAEYLGDTIEALVMATRAGLTVRQVPVQMRARAGGRPSQNPLRSTLYLARATIALAFALTRPRVKITA